MSEGVVAQAGPRAAETRLDRAAATAGRYEPLIARVFVNTVAHGDVALLHDGRGGFLVPPEAFATWGFAVVPAPVQVDGEAYVPLAELPGVETRFDTATVTLHVTAPARAMRGTRIDLRPQRRADVVYTDDRSVFLNYGLDATGDDGFAGRRYHGATEFGARLGRWLLYNTTDHAWGETGARGSVRLLTRAQHDDRHHLRRLTVGDFFTPGFDLSSSVPMGGVSLTKDYSLDPYFVQYPTAALRTEVAFPSTVQVRVGGNVVAQRQVQAGSLDITSITGVAGAQNVDVVIRDPFGREQVLQQPFFFATEVGLARGLHEYSYNAGFLRQDYGLRSNAYGDPAFSAFHRYAFTDALTLGLRGQATRGLYNAGAFGTLQLPRFGVLAAGASAGGSDGRHGYAASAAYTYTGGRFTVALGARYLSREFAQLGDLVTPLRQRSSRYASASAFGPGGGTLTASYYEFEAYDGPRSRFAGLNYTVGLFGNRAVLTLGATRNFAPLRTSLALVSLRYYFDRLTSVVGSASVGSDVDAQSVSLQRTVPQGEGIGYTVTGGRAASDGSDAVFGRGFVQANGRYGEAGAEYARSSGAAAPGFSRAYVAGSIGAVGGAVFASRPVFDSFALVRIPDMPDVHVHSNGWYVGRTDASGEVVATNLNSYYDNFISFGTGDLPFDYVFPSAEKVVSPPQRSGSLVTFEVRRMRAVFGVVVDRGTTRPLEFRELVLARDGQEIRGFTARRGEFYVEGVQPGQYLLRLDGGAPCSARVVVPADAGAMTDVGRLECVPVAR